MDVRQEFKVIKYDREIIDENVSKTEEGQIKMECHLIGNRSIDQCLFVTPGMKVLRPYPHQVNMDKFNYFGSEGIARGECSIRFNNDQVIDEGT